jgi:AmmeMemoRadiSam system protein A
MNNEYTDEEKRELLKLARNVIKAKVSGVKTPSKTTDNKKFKSKRGVFVTLHKNKDLRGCIGYPLPVKPLYSAIIDNAISSATEDPRFPQVTEDELDKISIEISILTVPQEIEDYHSIIIGKDGIIISKDFNRGLFLPQVPVEQGWNLEQYLSYGCLKAGLIQDEWKKEVKIETFQAIIFSDNDYK